MPAFVQQAFGIAFDQKDLLGLLDQEAELLADQEDELADLAAEIAMSQPEGVEEDWEPSEDEDDEDSNAE